MTLKLQIATGATTPIYQQIIDQVCRAAAAGALAEGDQLPSVRALAQELVVNPNTVARAYADLVRAGVVEARPGRGLFVIKRRQVYARAERLRRLDESLDALVGEAAFLAAPEELRQMLDRKLGQLAPDSDRNGKGTP